MAEDIKNLSEDEKAVMGAIQMRIENTALKVAEGQKVSSVIKDMAKEVAEWRTQTDILRQDAEFELPLLKSDTMAPDGTTNIRFTCRNDGALDVFLIDEEKSNVPVLYGRVQADKKGNLSFAEAPARNSDGIPVSDQIDRDYFSFGDRGIADYQQAVLNGIGKFITYDRDPDSPTQTALATMGDNVIDFATVAIPGGIISPAVSIDIVRRQPEIPEEDIKAYDDAIHGYVIESSMRTKDAQRKIEAARKALEFETDKLKKQSLENNIRDYESYFNNIPNIIRNELMALSSDAKYDKVFAQEFDLYESGNQNPIGTISLKLNPYMTPEGNLQKMNEQLKEQFMKKDPALMALTTKGASIEGKGGDSLVFCPPINVRETLARFVSEHNDKAVIISDGMKEIPVNINYDEKKDKYIFKSGNKKLDIPERQVASQIASTKTIRLYTSQGKTDREPFNLKEFAKKIITAPVKKVADLVYGVKADLDTKKMLQPEVRQSRANLADAIYKGTAMIEKAVNKRINEAKDAKRAYVAAVADHLFQKKFEAPYRELSQQYTRKHNELTMRLDEIKQDPSTKAMKKRDFLQMELNKVDTDRAAADRYYNAQYTAYANIVGLEEKTRATSKDLRNMYYGLNYSERAENIASFVKSPEGKAILTNVYNDLRIAASAQKVYIPLVIKENGDKPLKHEIYFSKSQRNEPIVVTYEQAGLDKNGMPKYKKLAGPDVLTVNGFAKLASQGLMEMSLLAEEKSYKMYEQNMEKHISEELSYKVTGAKAQSGKKMESIIEEANKKARKSNPPAERDSKTEHSK